MIPDTLYDLAFQFRKTKLWKKLYDSQLFAIRRSDGSIGYCCVMGMMGEHLALSVYPGDEGMDSYRLMGKDRSEMNDFELQETALSQNCAMLSFENKSELHPKEAREVSAYCATHGLTTRGKKAYPQFQRFRPRHLPWYLDDEADQALLAEALEAAIAVSEKLRGATPESRGFTMGAPFDRKIPLLEKKAGAFTWSEIALPDPKPVCYKSPEISDELALKRLSKSKKQGGEWACDIFMHVNPITDEEGYDEYVTEPKNAPFFPYLLITMDSKSDMVLDVQVAENQEDYSEQFAQAILDIAQKRGKPTRILVCNKRTHAFFVKLADLMGAKLVMTKQMPLLEEAKQAFWDRFTGEEGEAEDAIEQMIELLRNPEALVVMPDEMLDQLAQIVGMRAFPDDIVKNVQRECERRGMR